MKDSPLRPTLFLNIAVVALFWLLLFNRLHTEWVVNTLYSYGWAVPLLALYLFMERWRDRPRSAVARPHPLWLILPALLILAYAPIRIVNEANPDWVKINFYMTATVAAFSFAALFAMGRIRYMWHFGFPILFTFTALPWPVWMEDTLVQTLTRWDTDLSAELLTVSGIPALASGNLIQIGTSWVNVEEACSGIRSLQTAFMMSLFLGEFYRLNAVLRVLLMLSSFAVAFGLNVARTMTLTFLTGQSGPSAIEKWHDPLGTAVMLLCLFSLWLLSVGFEKLKGKFSELPSPKASAEPQKSVPVPLPFPIPFIAFSIFCLLAAEATTEGWYRYHEAKLVKPADWRVRWPEKAESFKVGEFPDRTRAILKYNHAETASWITSESFGWQMYYIQWLPGRVSKFLSGAHYPTVCLPATGLKFVAETGKFVCPAGSLEIPFTTFLFKSGQQDVYVFHAILEDRPAPDGEKISYRQVDSSERIDSVLRGHRNLGQRVLGISVTGPLSLEEAETTVRRTLADMISETPTHIAQLR